MARRPKYRSDTESLIKAVQEFNSLVPTLTSFAQSLTGRANITVRADTQTKTDGNTIFLRPPVELSYSAQHIRSLCDVRDGNELACPACQRAESLFFLLFHEMSHILGQSLAHYANSKMLGMKIANSVRGNQAVYDLVKDRLDNMKHSSQQISPPEIAEYYHRYFRHFWLAVEDIRVERMTGEVRPGFTRMSWFEGVKVIESGAWMTAKDDAQLPVAVLCADQGHDLVPGFSERVCKAVNVPEVAAITSVPIKDTIHSLLIAAELVAYFNERGFLDLTAAEESNDPEDAENAATDAEFEAVMGKMNGHTDDEPENGRKKKSDDARLGIIIEQAENFDDFSETVGRLIVKNASNCSYFRSISKPGNAQIQGSVLRARRIFSDSKMDRHVANLKRGKLNPRSLGARAWGDDERLFHKKLRAEGVSFEVVIGGDFSYSTAHGGKIERIKEIMYCISELLNRVGVDFSVYAHSTETPDEGEADYDQLMMKIKGINAPWNDEARNSLLNLGPVSGSLDGHNFEFYRKVLQKSRANKKLMIYFTDGQIPETNSLDEKPIIQREVKKFAQQEIAVLVVAVETAKRPTEAGMDTILVEHGTGIEFILKEVEKRIF